jgi:tetratricopeptide (TPR) repeat protein
MRYVAGETLAKQIATARERSARPSHRAELAVIALLFERAARALHVAHEAGVVHRDIKPANIMVTPEGEPVVLDFGLARNDDGSANALSLTGEVSGTPAYMSPEQMTGRSRPDRRTDVWSLGVALYEVATLAHPFESATREGLFQAILGDELPDPRRANAAIDRDFATIIETATAKNRDQRYQTALDLAEDLRRWRANEPIRARRVGRVERMWRWAQRKPALAASAAAIVLLALAASALLAYGVGASGKADVEAKLRATAEEARKRADEARFALEQAARDRAFSAELDELNMQMGTLLVGMEDPDSVASIGPAYVAAFERYGLSIATSEQKSAVLAGLEQLRARDPERWETALDALRNLGWIVTRDDAISAESSRTAVLAILQEQPGAHWPELEAADHLWRTKGVDTFGPFLEESALAKSSTADLYTLVGELLVVPARTGDAQRILERCLEKDPGSFRLHFLAAAVGFMQAKKAQTPGAQPVPGSNANIVRHMEIAVALRPRSGFVRAMLATALAIDQRYVEAVRCMDAATALEPDNALVWLFRARFYSYTPLGANRVIEACQRALELDPSMTGARMLLSQYEERSER